MIPIDQQASDPQWSASEIEWRAKCAVTRMDLLIKGGEELGRDCLSSGRILRCKSWTHIKKTLQKQRPNSVYQHDLPEWLFPFDEVNWTWNEGFKRERIAFTGWFPHVSNVLRALNNCLLTVNLTFGETRWPPSKHGRRAKCKFWMRRAHTPRDTKQHHARISSNVIKDIWSRVQTSINFRLAQFASEQRSKKKKEKKGMLIEVIAFQSWPGFFKA